MESEDESFGLKDSNDVSSASFGEEQTIRAIVHKCATDGLAADIICLNAIGLCRSLGALSQAVGEQTNSKKLSMEAAGVITATATCERMLKSIGEFHLINTYRFIGPEEDE